MKKLLLLVFGLMLAGSQSCSKFVEDINTNPNDPADAPMSTILNSCFTGMLVPFAGEDARLGAMWSQQFTGVDRQYAALNVYGVSTSSFTWSKYYLIAKNADLVIEKATVTNNKMAIGVAKTLKALCFGTVLALYGDVPLLEANQFPKITDPKFDGQVAGYASCQTLLDEAIADLSAATASAEVTSVDFYFGGDAAKWKAAANSLKARYYLHTGEYAKAITAAQGGILDTANDWLLEFGGGNNSIDQNIYNAFGVDFRQGYMDASASHLAAILDAANPSSRANAKTNEAGRFAALFTGAVGAYDLNYEGYWSPTSTFPVITAAETHLIMAEAHQRNGATDMAITHLNHTRAINAAKFTGTYSDYVLADFESGGMVNVTGQTAGASVLAEVIEEKYCSLPGELEVFNDLRRTNNAIGLTPTQGTQIPERFLYPIIEINTNTNVPNPLPSVFQPTAVNQ